MGVLSIIILLHTHVMSISLRLFFNYVKVFTIFETDKKVVSLIYYKSNGGISEKRKWCVNDKKESKNSNNLVFYYVRLKHIHN